MRTALHADVPGVSTVQASTFSPPTCHVQGGLLSRRAKHALAARVDCVRFARFADHVDEVRFASRLPAY